MSQNNLALKDIYLTHDQLLFYKGICGSKKFILAKCLVLNWLLRIRGAKKERVEILI